MLYVHCILDIDIDWSANAGKHARAFKNNGLKQGIWKLMDREKNVPTTQRFHKQQKYSWTDTVWQESLESW